MSGVPVGMSGEILTLEDIHVHLGGREILRDVSFGLRAREFTGLIGANGAGKTTLLRVILGLQTPSHGRVLLEGQPRERGLRTIGYVPQKFQLDPDLPMRARDLVALGIDAHRLGIPRPSRHRRARVEEMLAAVGGEGFADSRVGRLSGGEQQRILIAHALISRPRLLLLDEPLANLDIRAGQEVITLLARLSRDHGVAVLISAHEMNPLLGVMDRLAYVAHGRVASGTTEEVVRADVLTALYGHPVEVLDVHGRVVVVAGHPEDDSREGADVASVEVIT
jgi:zinc/manganese transport system ATP-binding protein